MVPVAPGKVGRVSSQDGMDSVCRLALLAMLSPTKMNFISERQSLFKIGLFVYIKVFMTCRWPVTLT